MIKIIPEIFSPQELAALEAAALGEILRPVPNWLGTFKFKIYGECYGRKQGLLPPELKAAAIKLIDLFAPGTRFNAAFLQCYPTGSEIHEHRDPANNINCTIVAPFGTFTGGNLIIGNKTQDLSVGGAILFPTTVNGKQGPKHRLTKIKSGTRWALILNQIV